MAADSGTTIAKAMERRLAPRLSFIDKQRVSVDLDFQRGALLLDLSPGGIGLQAAARIQTGTSTSVHFHLPEKGGRVDAIGTVAWSDNSGRMAIRFDQVDVSSRPHLEAWLARRRPQPQESGPVPDSPSWPLSGAPDDRAAPRSAEPAPGLEPDPTMGFVLERACSLTGASGAALALEEDGAFVCRSSRGAAPAVGARLNPTTGLSGECVRTGEVVRCDDTDADARVDSAVCRSLNLRSAVIIPVKTGKQLIGVLEVFSSQAHAFADGDVLLLRDLAGLISDFSQGVPLVGAIPTPPPPELPAATPAIVELPPEPAEPMPFTVAAEAATPPEFAAAAITPAAVAAASEALPAALPEPFPSLAAAKPVSVHSPRLKFLLVGLGIAMLAGSTFAGWHWGQFLHPAPVPVATNPAPVPAVPASVAVLPAPPVTRPETPVAAPKPAVTRKQDVPRLVPSGSAQGQPSSPEPPPAIPSPTGEAHDASGLTAVLNVPAAPAVLEKQAPVSRGVTGGKLIRKIEPLYPPSARSLHVTGAVVLRATVDTRGRVTQVSVVSGNSLLAGAAINAVRGWRYEPFMVNGIPVATDVTIKVNFAPNN